MAIDHGYLTEIAFASGVTFSTATFEIIGATINGASRESIPTTHFLTQVAETFIPADRYDPGELVCQARMDHSAALILWAEVYGTASTEATSNPGKLCTIKLGGDGTRLITFIAFTTNADFDLPIDGLVTFELTFKNSGNLEFAVA